ncbi:MAG: hypothetical protein RI945_56 [Candidatus Parcubacteria bacterium]|jgi:D-alanine-D-alanine ligase-like ATP-grasp enzyme
MREKKKKIAILRGGQADYHRSMKSGANILLSLLKLEEECEVLDVVIDINEKWFEKGVPSDPHRVFSKADFYIDFTEYKHADYHDLAEKLNVMQVFKNDFINNLNRVNVKRIFRQIDINTPRYEVIRDDKNLDSKLKDIWNRFHTPIVIKEVEHHFNEKSLITYSFPEALNKAKYILKKGGEVLIEEHAEGKYLSIVAIPDYRGEDIYVPTPIEMINLGTQAREVNGKILKDKYLSLHDHEKKSLVHVDINLKKELKRLATAIHQSLLLDFHTLIDVVLIEEKNNKESKKGEDRKYFIKVLELHTLPHMFEDSRFDFIMKNSGVDLGRFVLDRIQVLEEQKLSY